MQVLLAELDRIARDNAQQQHTAPIILTGDFNIQQSSEVFQLIIGESVTPRELFEKMDFNFGYSSSENLLPHEMGISDECQHFDVVVNSNRYQTAVGIYLHEIILFPSIKYSNLYMTCFVLLSF